MQSKSKVDLHLHTTTSDGTFNPSEVVSYAQKIGLKTISITDHDNVNSQEEALSAGKQAGIEVIPGIEMSSDLHNKDVHILGYCIDYRNKDLGSFIDILNELRLERAEMMIERLRNRNVDITFKEVCESCGDSTLTRAHIAKIMVAKGCSQSTSDAFDTYLGRDRPCYVKRNDYYSPFDVVEIILGAGGVPVLAHPQISGVNKYIPEFVEYGIMGIEVYAKDHTEKQVKMYLEIAKQYELLVTGGSDDHGPDIPGRFYIGQVYVPEEVVPSLKKAGSMIKNMK